MTKEPQMTSEVAIKTIRKALELMGTIHHYYSESDILETYKQESVSALAALAVLEKDIDDMENAMMAMSDSLGAMEND